MRPDFVVWIDGPGSRTVVTTERPQPSIRTMNTPFDLQRFLEQMTDQFGQTSQWLPEEATAFGAGHRFPIDLSEHPEEFVVTAELPGFEQAEIDLRITDRSLWIEAEHEEEEHEGAERHIRRERRSERMHRSVRLPEAIDPDGAEAKLHNGVLTISVPKAHQDENARQIDIDSA